MQLQNKKDPKPIDKVLSWAQRLQTSCFGTPVNISISTYKYAENCKTFNIGVSGGENVIVYVFDSTMPNDDLYQEWGKCKDYVNKLLDKLVGRRINAHGKVTHLQP